MAGKKIIFVTGSSRLIGSEVCLYFHHRGFVVHGLDNNHRATFFGPRGDMRWNQQRLARPSPGFVHQELDTGPNHRRAPRRGEVYDLGDGKENFCSILEAFDLTEIFTGKAQTGTFVNRRGDHICYSTGLRKRRAPYLTKWDITESLEQKFGRIVPL
jgi:hypothetical protein